MSISQIIYQYTHSTRSTYKAAPVRAVKNDTFLIIIARFLNYHSWQTITVIISFIEVNELILKTYLSWFL